jgi:hypothetical protein
MRDYLVVHHRRPGVSKLDLMVTLCPACHAIVHRLKTLRAWLPENLVTFWHEQHPEAPVVYDEVVTHGVLRMMATALARPQVTVEDVLSKPAERLAVALLTRKTRPAHSLRHQIHRSAGAEHRGLYAAFAGERDVGGSRHNKPFPLKIDALGASISSSRNRGGTRLPPNALAVAQIGSYSWHSSQ